MGAAGELVLAARYLELDGRQLRLRSLRIATAGKSNINTVNTLNVASSASPIPVAVIGFFISGGQALVPEGTIAEAKTAEPFVLAIEPKTAAESQTSNSEGEEKP